MQILWIISKLLLFIIYYYTNNFIIPELQVKHNDFIFN